ncbi:MAG TPA: MFS transporter [Vicinamibacterales bacterium]|nr:MFS transporter [Vicinamibacterales bacterium]
MSRPLLVIFLTVFVNLVGFGIIIPLLPFYAATFGASPVTIGLLFAAFSLAQLVAAPALGALSDRYGRRPVLIFSLIGTVISFVMLAMAQSLTMLFAARVIDGLSGGNITIARAYIADVTERDERARAYGFLGAAFGLGFIVGPGLAGLFAHVSYTAPIWAAAAVTLLAVAMAWLWLPETVHRGAALAMSPWRALPEVCRRRQLRPLLVADFLYWCTFAVCTTTFALFASRRFGFDLAQTGYVLAAFGVLGVIVQAGFVGIVVGMIGVLRTFLLGLVIAAAGWGLVAVSSSVTMLLIALIPAGVGVGLCNASIVTLVSHSGSKEEQGTVQGAAGGLESLGRAIGPVWGHSALQRFGEGSAYASAALAFAATTFVMLNYHQPTESANDLP